MQTRRSLTGVLAASPRAVGGSSRQDAGWLACLLVAIKDFKIGHSGGPFDAPLPLRKQPITSSSGMPASKGRECAESCIDYLTLQLVHHYRHQLQGPPLQVG